MMLDWPKNFDIINGIVLGLLYLHHVGLLSVQCNPADRPSMPAAVVMLSGEGSLPQPQKPGFYSERGLNELEVDPSSKAFSANEVTILLH
ncbi:hypothetical protein L3X38_013037 [Prunus dulcis]|uniref:Uncharacterized protein n=1 Tax=Prunus dulcis TaxID=3755 RepID=A0AAD4ZGL5_PRUDU|nr:hypothetical protein L3X38_013037 [Prunus dulcis]